MIRYQVFISSTFEDLKQERAEVMQALLELDCIPAGMELFPANNDEQWAFIRKVIEQSDYYLVVIGGKYGSIHLELDKSFTEMEYEYAVSVGKPVIAFVLDKAVKLTEDKIEIDAEKRCKLESFKAKVTATRLCKFWSSSADLGAKVSRSVTQMIRQQPGVGWVRSDEAARLENSEVLRLRNHVLELEKELAAEKVAKRELASFTLNESEAVTLQVRARRRLSLDEAKQAGTTVKSIGLIPVKTTWGDLTARISSTLIVKNTAKTVASTLSRAYKDDVLSILGTQHNLAEDAKASVDWQLDDQSFARIRAMLVAAGFIVVDVQSVTTSSPSSIFKYDAGTRLSTTPIEYWVPTAEGIKYFGPKAVSRFALLEDDVLHTGSET